MSVLENAKKLYLEGIEQGNYINAIKNYATADYKQHSTGVKTGRDGFIEFFADFVIRFPKREIEIIHAFEENNFAFLMAKQNLNGIDSWITMDIFRGDKNSRMAEHWDIIESYKTKIDGTFEFEDNSYDLINIIEDNLEDFDKFININTNHSNNTYKIKKLKIHQSVRYKNFVAILGEFFDEIGYASIHLFRFSDNNLVEYWDVIEQIPTPEVSKNSGKF